MVGMPGWVALMPIWSSWQILGPDLKMNSYQDNVIHYFSRLFMKIWIIEGYGKICFLWLSYYVSVFAGKQRKTTAECECLLVFPFRMERLFWYSGISTNIISDFMKLFALNGESQFKRRYISFVYQHLSYNTYNVMLRLHRMYSAIPYLKILSSHFVLCV